MRSIAAAAIIGILAGCISQDGSSLRNTQTMVFLGSSTTDGFTYAMLVKQALLDAGLPAPRIVNAGVGGDVTAGMRKRLERDVLSFEPSLVVVQAGANDAGRKTSAIALKADLDPIVKELRGRGIEVVLLTPNVRGPKRITEEPLLEQYISAMREVGDAHGAKIADAYVLEQKARDCGEQFIEEDGLHLSFEGCRIIARAVLDALGHPSVPVPKELSV